MATPPGAAIVERDRDGYQNVFTNDVETLLDCIAVGDSGVHRPKVRSTTLEDVFLLLTGRELRS